MKRGTALSDTNPPTLVESPAGSIRLKWHKLRTSLEQAPFKVSNLKLGWTLGASLEVDVLAANGDRFVVLHDPTLGPSSTGHGRVASTPLADMSGLFHRDQRGVPDDDAPVLSLADLAASVHGLPRNPAANLQLDLKMFAGRPLADKSISDAAAAVKGLEDAIVIGSHHLDAARRLAAAIPGARVGYDPMLAASRDPDLVRKPERLLRHIERRRAGVTLIYLSFGAVIASEERGFPIVRRLLDLGMETDAWTLNPGPGLTDRLVASLAHSGVRQITTDAPVEIAKRLLRVLTSDVA